MLLDLKFTIITLGIGAGTFLAGLYGMNLKNFIEETDFGFPVISLSCGVLASIAVVWGLRKLRKVQRLSMWGEGSSMDNQGLDRMRARSGKGSWREVEPQSVSPPFRTPTAVERMGKRPTADQRRTSLESLTAETSPSGSAT